MITFAVFPLPAGPPPCLTVTPQRSERKGLKKRILTTISTESNSFYVFFVDLNFQWKAIVFNVFFVVFICFLFRRRGGEEALNIAMDIQSELNALQNNYTSGTLYFVFLIVFCICISYLLLYFVFLALMQTGSFLYLARRNCANSLQQNCWKAFQRKLFWVCGMKLVIF